MTADDAPNAIENPADRFHIYLHHFRTLALGPDRDDVTTQADSIAGRGASQPAAAGPQATPARAQLRAKQSKL